MIRLNGTMRLVAWAMLWDSGSAFHAAMPGVAGFELSLLGQVGLHRSSSAPPPSYTFSGMRHVHFTKDGARSRSRGDVLHISPVSLDFETHSKDPRGDDDSKNKNKQHTPLADDFDTAACVMEWAEAVQTALDDKRRIDEVVGMFAYDGIVKVRPSVRPPFRRSVKEVAGRQFVGSVACLTTHLGDDELTTAHISVCE